MELTVWKQRHASLSKLSFLKEEREIDEEEEAEEEEEEEASE